MDSIQHMPTSTATPTTDASRPLQAGDPAARKAHFWDRSAREHATHPIADMSGYEAKRRRVRGLLSVEMNVLQIGCGTGSTALHRVARGSPEEKTWNYFPYSRDPQTVPMLRFHSGRVSEIERMIST